jgi:hypothetical protein
LPLVFSFLSASINDEEMKNKKRDDKESGRLVKENKRLKVEHENEMKELKNEFMLKDNYIYT